MIIHYNPVITWASIVSQITCKSTLFSRFIGPWTNERQGSHYSRAQAPHLPSKWSWVTLAALRNGLNVCITLEGLLVYTWHTLLHYPHGANAGCDLAGVAPVLTGDPLHSRAACTQPCNVNTHSRAHCSRGARLCEQWVHGCVNNGTRLCASARLCRGSPVITGRFWGECDRWFLFTMASGVEKVSMWWRCNRTCIPDGAPLLRCGRTSREILIIMIRRSRDVFFIIVIPIHG